VKLRRKIMARARNIKPSFFTNEYLSDLPPHARLLFIGLWCLVDREGRMEHRPRRIKAEIFPYEDVDCTSLAQCLHSSGFIQVYSVGGKEYLEIPSFVKHQNPHMREKSMGYPPAPVQHSASPAESPLLNVESPLLKEEVCAPKVARTHFNKPSLQEISDYCNERMNNVDPNKFLNFYDSKGWMVGKNKMKDWKACVRTWESKNENTGNSYSKPSKTESIKRMLDEFDNDDTYS